LHFNLGFNLELAVSLTNREVDMNRPEFTDVETTYQYMKDLLSEVVPEMELRVKAELVVEIEKLKKERNAVILGHNYMEPALYHTVPDFKGDSLQLARYGATTDAEMIVFCGVEFMAETAKILSPEKTVLIPSQKAGCSLASSITGEDVRNLKKLYPGVPVVSYVNTYADVKAETDICCTSSNAIDVVNSLDSESVIFIPDMYLAANVARDTNKRLIVPKKIEGGVSGDPAEKDTMISWPGYCEVHDKFTVQDIEDVRKQFPDVVVLAHPECKAEVCEAADFSGSTSAMINYVKENNAPRYLLLTECSMGDNIIAENKDKELLRLCSHRCPHMAQITLEMTRDALKFGNYEVNIDEPMRLKAKGSLERMVEIGR
jgi:quinolinate synthase